MELIGIEDVMEIMGVGRRTATNILRSENCPTLPRVKGGKYLVDRSAFIDFVRGYK